MAHLAIRGHATRGKEVIEILEMLGGKTRHGKLEGHELSCGYYINVAGYVGFRHYSLLEDTTIFTLEEFLEKYPYKVGDKVIYHESVAEIDSMGWDGIDVVYTVNLNDELWDTIAFNLRPYKEAPMYLNRKVNEQAEEIKKVLEPVKEIIEGVYAYNEINCYHQDFGDKVRIRLGNDFEIKVEDNKTYIVKKQPQYPKTYEECCEILNWNHRDYDRVGYNSELLCKLQVLLLCRDAYWKIAGDWKYDVNKAEDYFYIVNKCGCVVKEHYMNFNHILAFPSEEMRDAFYENFKELIELCKELL